MYVASDMSLAAKPTWTSRARVEEFAQMRNAAENLRVLAEWYVTLSRHKSTVLSYYRTSMYTNYYNAFIANYMYM